MIRLLNRTLLMRWFIEHPRHMLRLKDQKIIEIFSLKIYSYLNVWKCFYKASQQNRNEKWDGYVCVFHANCDNAIFCSNFMIMQCNKDYLVFGYE